MKKFILLSCCILLISSCKKNEKILDVSSLEGEVKTENYVENILEPIATTEKPVEVEIASETLTEEKLVIENSLETTSSDSNHTGIVFESYIDKADPYYEFYVQNPLFISSVGDTNSFLINNLDNIKNKIVKTKTYAYDQFDDGSKYYGDGNPVTTINYYFFDSNGHIYKQLYIYLADNYEIPFYKSKTEYQYNQVSYDVIETDFLNHEIQTNHYSISENEGKLILENLEDEGNIKKQIIYEKGKITIINQKYDWSPDIRVYTYNGDYSLDEIFSRKDERDIINWQMKYYKKAEIYREQFLENGINKTFYEFNDDYTNGTLIVDYKNAGKIVDKEKRSTITRKYSQLGFMESETVVPYELEVGSYNFIEVTLSDETDEILVKYFEDE